MKTLFACVFGAGFLWAQSSTWAQSNLVNAPQPGSVTPPPPALVLEAPMTAAPTLALNTATAMPPTMTVDTNSVSTNHVSTNTVNLTQAPVDLAEIGETEETTELIHYVDAPLHSVITALARLAKINIMIDPALLTAPDGKPMQQPNINVRLENVTAQQALLEVLDNHDYMMVQNPKTRIARITRKNVQQPPLFTKIIPLQYSSPTNMAVLVTAIFTDKARSQVIPDVRTSTLVVRTTEKDMEAVDELIKNLDSPTRQVLIEARILETSQNPQSIKGIDWSGTLENQRFSFGNGLTSGSTITTSPGQGTTTLPSGRVVGTTTDFASQTVLNTSIGGGGVGGSGGSGGGSSGSSGNGGSSGGQNGLSGPGGISLNTARGFSPNVAFLNADGVSAVLSFLNKDSDTEVVATPRAVTLDNEMASLSVTRAFPIFQTTPSSANTPGSSMVQYTNLGTILKVTPRISGSNNVSLLVQPEVSNIDSKDQQTMNGQVFVANIYAVRRIETHVIIPSGNTLVMGGLISDTTTKSHNKVPLLGDLPVVGLAFRRDTKSRLKQNLLIFITPTIIRDADFQQLPPSGFMQLNPKDHTNEKETAWDSGKPYDWKKSSKNKR